MQIRGSKADQRRPLAGGALGLSLPCKSSVVIPGSPSARLTPLLRGVTRGLKLNTGQRQTNDICWLLRFSVLRETRMTSTLSVPFQKVKMTPKS
jgi:hypothetical protein